MAAAFRDLIKEKSQPDAFACAMFTHQVHAVIPVAGTHKGQAVLTHAETSQDGADAMFIQAGRFFRPAGQIVIRVLLHFYLAAFNGRRSEDNFRVARDFDGSARSGAVGDVDPAQFDVILRGSCSFRMRIDLLFAAAELHRQYQSSWNYRLEVERRTLSPSDSQAAGRH